MAALCRQFSISRKTGYKNFERYKECDLEALTELLQDSPTHLVSNFSEIRWSTFAKFFAYVGSRGRVILPIPEDAASGGVGAAGGVGYALGSLPGVFIGGSGSSSPITTNEGPGQGGYALLIW